MSKQKSRPAEGHPAPDAAADADDGLRRLMLGVAGGLFFAGFLVALAAVLYRPERVVLVGMDPLETTWFRASLKQFADRHHARLTIRAYRDPAELDSLLAADRKSRSPKILLFEAPPDRLAALVDSGAVAPLGEEHGLVEPTSFLDMFAPAAASPASIGGRVYFVPSRLSTICLCYSRARVADAVAHAGEARAQVESWLREVNGIGLPADYRLEDDPSQWDSYDLLLVSAYWASSPFIDGTAPRVAHVAAPAAALGFDLAARSYSMGGQDDALLALDGFGIRDALAWESLYFAHGLYDTAMVAEAWDEDHVVAEVAAGRIWLATLEPARILRLHGLAGAADSTGRRVNSDIGLARLPRGVSLELKNKFPERSGDPWSARAGAWWAVPAKSPDRRLAIEVLRTTSKPDYQADASRTLGWIPVHKGLLDNLSGVFRDQEEYALARQAARQLYDFGRPLPASPGWGASARALSATWRDACAKRRLTRPLELAEALRLAKAAH